MMAKKWLACSLSVALWQGAASAQRLEVPRTAAPQAVFQVVPQNVVPAAPEQDPGVLQAQEAVKQAKENLRKATLEQRLLKERDAHRKWLSESLKENGLSDEKLENAILDFVGQQERERQQMRETAGKLFYGRKGVKDSDVAILLNEFKAQVESYKVQRAADVKALDNAIGFSANPRLEALLIFHGVINDDAAWLPGPAFQAFAPAWSGASRAFGDNLRIR